MNLTNYSKDSIDIVNPETEDKDDLWDQDTENTSELLYPLDRDDVQIWVTQRAIFAIIQYLKKWKILLQPTFQRWYVWKDLQAEKLIDSVRNNLPIPQLFLLQNNEWQLIVIDWQQRLTSLLRFYCDSNEIISITKDSAMHELKVSMWIFKPWETTHTTFKWLSDEQQTAFENQSLSFTTIKIASSITPEKSNRIAREIFHRLNTWWTNLTEQEIRFSIYNNAYTFALKELAWDSKQRQCLLPSTKKFNDNPSIYSEILLRCLALVEAFGDFGDKLKDYEYSKPYSWFFNNYAQNTHFFVWSDKELNDRWKQRLDAVERAISFLVQNNYLDVFKHEIDDKSKTFNIKYVDTILVWLVNYCLSNSNLWNDLIDKIKLFKNNQTNITQFIARNWDSDETYTRERVNAWIKIYIDAA